MRPTPHVLDHLGRDLLLSQVEREHGLAPRLPQPIHVELGHLQELALGGERSNPRSTALYARYSAFTPCFKSLVWTPFGLRNREAKAYEICSIVAISVGNGEILPQPPFLIQIHLDAHAIKVAQCRFINDHFSDVAVPVTAESGIFAIYANSMALERDQIGVYPAIEVECRGGGKSSKAADTI